LTKYPLKYFQIFYTAGIIRTISFKGYGRESMNDAIFNKKSLSLFQNTELVSNNYYLVKIAFFFSYNGNIYFLVL